MAGSEPLEAHSDEEILTEDLVQLMDQTGGLPRVAGRIFMALLTSDEPYLSGPELASRLGISSGSVSTMTRLLEQMGYVERLCRPKVRADLFRVSVDHWQSTLRKGIETSRRFQELTSKLADSVDSGDAKRRLEQFGRMHEIVADLLASTLDQWETLSSQDRR